MISKEEEYSIWDESEQGQLSPLYASQGPTHQENIWESTGIKKTSQRLKNTEVLDSSLSFESKLRAKKKEYVEINPENQQEMQAKLKAQQKKLLNIQSQRISELQAKYFKAIKKNQSLKGKAINLQSRIIDNTKKDAESRLSQNINQFQRSMTKKSLRLQSSNSKAEKKVDDCFFYKKNRSLWSQQEELILILLLSLQTLTDTTVNALLPYSMEQCQHYLKRNLYKLYNNLNHIVTQLQKNRSYLYKLNPILIDLFQQYLRKHPQPQVEHSEIEPIDFIGQYRPILSNLIWKKLQF